MSNQSRLHIPRPSARPGQEPDFSYLVLSDAGAVKRPQTDAASRDIEHLAHELVRVLDDNGQACGEWNPHLDQEQLLEALRLIMLTRQFDERMQLMQRQGKISFYIQSLGEEAISIAQGMVFGPQDMMFPSYRNQGLFIQRGTRLVDLMSQCLSNTNDMCKGRQMPIMYHNKQANIFSISGNLATQYPQAVGWAMASAIKGEDHIAASWLGDGSTAEADFHYGLTFATVYQAPVVLNVVNNQWAISSFQGVAGGERRGFAARGLGYGIPGIRVDGNDLLAIYAVTDWATRRARAGGGPTLIEHVTYRGGPHSTSDDPSRYRPKNEWDAFPLGDPLKRLKQHLIVMGYWSEEQHEELQKELKDEVISAWKEAISYGSMTDGPQLDVSKMFDDVYEKLPDHLRRQRQRLADVKGLSS